MNDLPDNVRAILSEISAGKAEPSYAQCVDAMKKIWRTVTGFDGADYDPYMPKSTYLFNESWWRTTLHNSRTRWIERFWEDQAAKLVIEGSCFRRNCECERCCPHPHNCVCPNIKFN